MSIKLKKCCGHEPVLKTSTYGWGSEEETFYNYKCEKCGMSIVSDNKPAAILRWNKAIETLK